MSYVPYPFISKVSQTYSVLISKVSKTYSVLIQNVVLDVSLNVLLLCFQIRNKLNKGEYVLPFDETKNVPK